MSAASSAWVERLRAWAQSAWRLDGDPDRLLREGLSLSLHALLIVAVVVSAGAIAIGLLKRRAQEIPWPRRWALALGFAASGLWALTSLGAGLRAGGAVIVLVAAIDLGVGVVARARKVERELAQERRGA